MIDPAHLQPLLDRQAQVAKRLGDLESRAAKIDREKKELEKERSAIETTLETLAKVYGVEASEEEKPSKPGTSTKPADAPTLFRMVETVLEENELWGDQFTEAQAIYDAIRKKWWPDAPRNSVIPSLYRFEKEGRLVKVGTRYGLPQKNEVLGALTPSTSEPEWERQ